MGRLRVALVALLLAGGVLVGRSVFADKVHLRSGRVVEGEVLDVNPEFVEVKFAIGSVKFRRDEVVEIEYELTTGERFDRQVGEAESADAIAVVIEQFEGKRITRDQVRAAWERALTLDPTHRRAHEELGHLYYNGKWLTSEEDKIRIGGWVYFDGELMPPEKAERLKRERREAAARAAEERRRIYENELKGVSWGRVKPIETEHYIIQCNSSPSVAKRYADFMEQIYAAYDEVFKGYKKHHTGKSKIYIFRNIKDFQEFGGGQPGVGGFYVPKSPNENIFPSRIVSAYHGTFGTTGDTRGVLAHEGTHQFQHLLCDGTPEEFLVRPPWWIEGLAVYFGDGYQFDKRGKLVVGIPRDRLMVIHQILKSGQAPKISQFIRLNLGQYQRMAGLTYPYGWALCHYFLHRGEVGGRQQAVEVAGHKFEPEKVFREFFDFVLADPPDHVRMNAPEYYASKFEQLLGFPVDDLMEDWKSYVLGLELEPLGEVTEDRSRYISKMLAFQIDKPASWVWRENEVQGREAIKLEGPTTTGLVTVIAEGNMDNASVEELRDQAERGAAMKLDSLYLDDEKTREIKVSGYKGYEFFYEGTERKPSGNVDREYKVRDRPQRYRHVVVSTLKRSYEIVMQADAERFDDNRQVFDEILRGFVIHE